MIHECINEQKKIAVRLLSTTLNDKNFFVYIIIINKIFDFNKLIKELTFFRLLRTNIQDKYYRYFYNVNGCV